MRHAFAIPILTALLIAFALTGCGSGNESSTSTAATPTTAGGNSAVCTSLSQVESSLSALRAFDPDTASAARVQDAVSNLAASVKGLSNALSEAGGKTRGNVEDAVKKFESQLSSAQNQPVSQQLTTLGTAIGQLNSSLSQAAAQFKCNR